MLQKVQVYPRVLEEQTSIEEVQSAKPGQGNQIGAVCRGEMEGKAIHSSIHAQRLLMGPKYNVATCVEELGGTKSYWRSKHLSKRVEVPNLAQAAKLEPFALVKWR